MGYKATMLDNQSQLALHRNKQAVEFDHLVSHQVQLNFDSSDDDSVNSWIYSSYS